MKTPDQHLQNDMSKIMEHFEPLKPKSEPKLYKKHLQPDKINHNHLIDYRDHRLFGIFGYILHDWYIDFCNQLDKLLEINDSDEYFELDIRFLPEHGYYFEMTFLDDNIDVDFRHDIKINGNKPNIEREIKESFSDLLQIIKYSI